MANDERRWKLFISNRVKEIQDLPQLLETLYYERQSSRLGQQGQPLRSTILSSTFSLFGKIGQLQKFEDVSLLCLLTLKIQHSYKTAHY
ncbi:hypothetical protein T03_14854 [Trichinella britovi]|uniref:Uncharacterized protein n=1 Tax=Trichinella britovi TaxID=45882 RepID=A0A0V1C5W4_TRIBR|nr:hypothetical protein T03_260 [Trichinella britovi]KRY44661.1 hypothetical protein T03_14854 [Trichinella britovi]